MGRFGILAGRPSGRRLIALVAVLALLALAFSAVASRISPRVSRPTAAPGKSMVTDRGKVIASEQSRSVSAARALGLGGGVKLVVKDVIADADGSTHVRYDQTFKGLRVIGGDFVSHRDQAGAVKNLDLSSVQKVALASTTPKLALASARIAGARKASSVQKTTSATKGELVVFAAGESPNDTPKLAYDVLTEGVRADQTPSRLHTIIDAYTGAALMTWDEIETGRGHGLAVGEVAIGTTAGPPWSMRDTVGNYTTDLKGEWDGPGTTFTDTDDNWGNGLVSDRASAGVDAQYGAEKAFEYFKTVQGRNGIWDNGVGARSRMHYGDGVRNTFWDGEQMTYGDGFDNDRPLVSLDIAAHEMTHGITQNTAGLINGGSSGGLNEGTSDIFGTAVEWFAGNASDAPDYLIGEKTNFDGTGKPLRYMDKPSRDGESADCWSPDLSDELVDTHYAAGPLNHWFYLASEGSGAKVVGGVSYDSPTCDSSTVAPIGRDKAAKIWYRTLTTYPSSNSTYAAGREGAIQSAKDLYGATSPECAGVAVSFSAIAVPPGAQTCSVDPPPPLGGNLLSNPGFESGDHFWSATPRIIGQWGSATPAQPAHSGTWSASMVGDDQAHHESISGLPREESISQLVTIPAGRSATLSYYVHIDTKEPPGSPEKDTLKVRAGSTVLQTLSHRNAAVGFQRKTVDLSPYVGRTISLSFSGTLVESTEILADGGSTSFVLDDLSVTASPVPVAAGEPYAVKATPEDSQARVSWTAGGDGGSPITGYRVRVVNAAGEQVGTLRPALAGATSLVVTGLVDGTAVSFQVQALNAIGESTFSNLSPVVLPTAVTRLSDFNRDGRTDLVARDEAGSLWLYPDDGPFRLGTRRLMGTGWDVFTAIVSSGDVTGDGNGDIFARNAAGQLLLYPGDGAGGFTDSRLVGATGWNAMTALTAAGDMTGDGRPDLLARDSAGRLWLYPMVGAGTFQTRRLIGSGGWNAMNAIMGAGDLSGDGKADLLARDSAGTLWLYRGSGAGALAARTSVATGWPTLTALVTPGNWDRADGNDLIAQDGEGGLWLYRGDNAGELSAPYQISSGFTAYTIA